MRKQLLVYTVVVATLLAVLLTPSRALAGIISSIPAGPHSVLLRTNGHTQVVRYQPGDRVEVVTTFQPSPLSGWTMPPQRMQVFGGHECWLHEFQTSPGYCAGAGGFVDGTGDVFWNYAYQPFAIQFTADRVGAIFVTLHDFDFTQTATAEVLVTVNDPNPPRRSIELKNRDSKLAAQWTSTSLGLGAIAAGCLFIPVPLYSRFCAGPFAITSVMTGIVAYHYRGLAADPPDPNYTVIDHPVVPAIPPTGSGVAEAELDALNASLAQTIAYLRAAIVSANRSSGALVAGDSFWHQQQVNALNSYAATVRGLTAAQPGLLQGLRNALVAAGLPPHTVDVPTMTQFQRSVGINGLPADMAANMTSLGLHSADLDVVRTMLATHPQPGPFSIAVQAQTFPDLLVDPALLNALAAVAAGGGTPPPPPDTNINVTPTTVFAGDTVTVNWGAISSPSALDWFGLFPQSGPETLQGLVPNAWLYVNCSQTPTNPTPDGACPFTVPPGLAPGAYELRLFWNDDFTPRLSATGLQVDTGPSSVALSATLLWWGEQEDVAIVHVQWSGIDPVTLTDWFGVYPPGTPDTEFNWWTYNTWAYLSCGHQPGTTILRPSGYCYFPIDPNLPTGTYEVRLFANDGFTRLGTASFTKSR